MDFLKNVAVYTILIFIVIFVIKNVVNFFSQDKSTAGIENFIKNLMKK